MSRAATGTPTRRSPAPRPAAKRPPERRTPSRERHPRREDAPALPTATLAFIIVVVLLNVLGVVMVLSASAVASMSEYGSVWHVFERQLLWTALGAVAFLIGFRVETGWWQRAALLATIAAAVLCLIVLVPGIGQVAGGSRRWLGFGWVGMQPSEVAKFAVLLFAADVLTRRHDRMWDLRAVFWPTFLVTSTLGALVLIEPDLDSTVVIFLIFGSILVAGGLRARHLLTFAASGVVLGLIAAFGEPYRRARVLTMLHPAQDASNTGYQIVQSLIALGSGGVLGVGLGAGSAKWHFLPNAHTDFVFSIIGEELGLIGCLAVLGLFVAFAWLGIVIALRTTDRFAMLLAVGIVVWVTAQAAINIAGVIGLLPVSGIPLPFVSFGGSSLVVTMLCAGILARVGRTRP